MPTEYFFVVALSFHNWSRAISNGQMQNSFIYWDPNDTGPNDYLIIESKTSKFNSATTLGLSEFVREYCVKISILPDSNAVIKVSPISV